MKILKPSMREKSRYVLFELRGGTWDKCKVRIIDRIREFMGISFFSLAGVKPVDNLSKENFFVLRVNRKHLNMLKSSAIFINDCKDSPIFIRSIIASGTLLKIRQKLREVCENGTD
ncbi:MAG TPA: hypothetical protein ENN46_02600 [Candidatus Woesearchaeota archaeon]|nr:hypothetical protein [Candidatus Woesearchaeota archaeon]